jgi:hypothetical protein
VSHFWAGTLEFVNECLTHNTTTDVARQIAEKLEKEGKMKPGDFYKSVRLLN